MVPSHPLRPTVRSFFFFLCKNMELYNAIRAKDFILVRNLLKHNPNLFKQWGTQMLFLALQFDKTGEMVRLLLEAGDDPNAADDFGVTALFFAQKMDESGELVRLLENYGADPNAPPPDNTSMSAVNKGFGKNAQMTRLLLLGHGANRNAPPLDDASMLMFAIRDGDFRKMYQLLSRNVDIVNATTSYGIPMLVIAMQFDESGETVRLLLEYGANPDATTHNGTPMLFFAMRDDESGEMTRLLLERDANPNAIMRDGTPMLMVAMQFDKNGEMARFFLERGANPNATMHDGTSMFYYAIRYDKSGKIVRLLNDYGANPTLLSSDVDRLDDQHIRPLSKIPELIALLMHIYYAHMQRDLSAKFAGPTVDAMRQWYNAWKITDMKLSASTHANVSAILLLAQTGRIRDKKTFSERLEKYTNSKTYIERQWQVLTKLAKESTNSKAPTDSLPPLGRVILPNDLIEMVGRALAYRSTNIPVIPGGACCHNAVEIIMDRKSVYAPE